MAKMFGGGQARQPALPEPISEMDVRQAGLAAAPPLTTVPAETRVERTTTAPAVPVRRWYRRWALIAAVVASASLATYGGFAQRHKPLSQQAGKNLHQDPTTVSIAEAKPKRYANEIAYVENLRLGEVARIQVDVGSSGTVHFGIYRPRADLSEHPLPETGEREMEGFRWDKDTPVAARFALNHHREDAWTQALRVRAWRDGEAQSPAVCSSVFIGTFDNKALHISRCDWEPDKDGNVVSVGHVLIHFQLPKKMPPKAILSIELDSYDEANQYGPLNKSRTAYLLSY